MSVLGFSTKNKSEEKEKHLIKVFSALGDGTRYRLIKLLLNNKDICVSELAEQVGITVAGTSQQLRILEQNGIVEHQRQGQKMCYRLRSDDSTIKKLIRFIED